MIGFALLIGRVSPLYITLLCLAAFSFNIFLLPSITHRNLEKKEDRERGYSLGLLSYPFILFLLSMLFFEQQIFLAIGWGAMAFGDAFAALGGKKWRGAPIPWNREKSWGGFFSFLVFAFPLTIGFLYLLPQALWSQHTAPQWLAIIGLAMAVGAFVETVPGFIDDNLTVPVAASLTAFVAAAWMQRQPNISLPENWLIGGAAILAFMVLSYLSGKIDISGSLVGGLIAIFIFLGGGFLMLGLLLVFFTLGSAASVYRKAQKQRWMLEEKNEGKRSAANAWANGGVVAVCGVAAWTFPDNLLLYQTMLAASLAAALSDTLSSELGNVLGKRYVNILSWKTAIRGQDGAISLEGTIFGIIGSILMAACFWWSSQDFEAVAVVAVCGFAGNLADSVLGATLQRKGLMNNHTVNVACTLTAALLAWALSGF